MTCPHCQQENPLQAKFCLECGSPLALTCTRCGARQAKSFELRAVTSLSGLLKGQGRREEARRTLGDIYGWFTEGFDTADLREARALLEELS